MAAAVTARATEARRTAYGEDGIAADVERAAQSEAARQVAYLAGRLGEPMEGDPPA